MRKLLLNVCLGEGISEVAPAVFLVLEQLRKNKTVIAKATVKIFLLIDLVF